ncbi:MAG: UDP-glucose/iron transport system permease protein [Halanaerobiales bacterium]|nr:UDP-glucose/iron transport system permease protein [Halanaerobiales bacterium]
MTDIIDISTLRLAVAYIFILILLFIVKINKVGHEGEIIIASIRMTIQLVLVGYVLTYIFDNPGLIYSLLILLIMEGFAIKNIYDRVNRELSKSMKLIIAMAMISGTMISIIYFIIAVINLKPWYQPQYFIPLSGMLIGNSMTGIALGTNGLIEGIRKNKDQIENALMLGARPEQATRDISNNAFYNAILPTINSMLGMGIVFLPGMMTGQILAGAPPLTAIKYQIAIMLGISGSVTLTVYIMVKAGIKTFFNERAQLEIF